MVKFTTFSFHTVNNLLKTIFLIKTYGCMPPPPPHHSNGGSFLAYKFDIDLSRGSRAQHMNILDCCYLKAGQSKN